VTQATLFFTQLLEFIFVIILKPDMVISYLFFLLVVKTFMCVPSCSNQCFSEEIITGGSYSTVILFFILYLFLNKEKLFELPRIQF
jgi:hypothetical protein